MGSSFFLAFFSYTFWKVLENKLKIEITSIEKFMLHTIHKSSLLNQLLNCVSASELRKPASNTSMLAEHSDILQEHYE